MTYFFERASAPDAYAQALASAYYAGYRLYDPSFAAYRDPESEKKMMRWPPFATNFQLRHASICGRKWTCSAAEDGGDREKALARIGKQLLRNVKGFMQARLNLARADVSGARYAERVRRVIRARYGDGKERDWVVPVALRDMPKENFRWVPSQEREHPEEERTPSRVLEYARKTRGAIRWVRVPATAPLLHHVIGDSEETHGYGRGLRDALFFLHNAWTRIFQADVQAGERFGHGWLVLTLASDKSGKPTITNDTLVTQAQNNLKKHRANHNFVIGEGDKLEFLAPPGQAKDFMEGLWTRLERMADRLILGGGSMFAGGGGQSEGSFARTETEADTSAVVFDALSDMMEETFTDQLVVPTLRDNWHNLVDLGLAGADHPRYEVVRGRKKDPKSVAEWLEVAVRAGVPVTKKQALDLLDLEEAGEDDELLKPPQQSVGGGMGVPSGMYGGPDGRV